MTRTQLLTEIFKLDADEKRMIARAIYDHLSVAGNFESEIEFNAELDRRVAAADADPNAESPLDDVLNRLRNTS